MFQVFIYFYRSQEISHNYAIYKKFFFIFGIFILYVRISFYYFLNRKVCVFFFPSCNCDSDKYSLQNIFIAAQCTHIFYQFDSYNFRNDIGQEFYVNNPY